MCRFFYIVSVHSYVKLPEGKYRLFLCRQLHNGRDCDNDSPRFVDVGAFHPIHLSNTYFFERCLGWRCLAKLGLTGWFLLWTFVNPAVGGQILWVTGVHKSLANTMKIWNQPSTVPRCWDDRFQIGLRHHWQRAGNDALPRRAVCWAKSFDAQILWGIQARWKWCRPSVPSVIG